MLLYQPPIITSIFFRFSACMLTYSPHYPKEKQIVSSKTHFDLLLNNQIAIVKDSTTMLFINADFVSFL